MRFHCILLLVFSLSSTSTFSESILEESTLANHKRGFFAGGNISLIQNQSQIDSLIEDDKIALSAAEFVFGYKYNSFLGADLRLGTGLSKRNFISKNDAEDQIKYGLSNYGSIYFRPELINREAKFYLLLGYTQLDSTINLISEELITEQNISLSGSSYGLGVGWFIDKNWNVNIEYRALLASSSDEFSMIAVGFDYRFSNLAIDLFPF